MKSIFSLPVIVIIMLCCHCRAQTASRVVFFRMDANVGEHTSSFKESRFYADRLYFNDSMVKKMSALSVFIFDSEVVKGAYYLDPALNKSGKGHNTITINPPVHSITFVKISLSESRPITSFAEVISLDAFKQCYDKNKWLRTALRDEGFHSLKELTDGFIINTNDVYSEGIIYPLTSEPTHLQKRSTDTLFYNSNNKIVSREIADFYTVVHLESPDYYRVNEYDVKSGSLIMTGHYSNIDSEINEGLFLTYFKDGNLSSKGVYVHDKEEGVWEYYYDTTNAQVWYKCNFVNGHRQGELTTYYRNGKLKRKENHESLSQMKEVSVDGAMKNMLVYKDTITSGECFDTNGNNKVFTAFEIMPRPPYDLTAYLSKNLRYPDRARRKNIEGHVAVEFIVNEDGSISDMKVTRHVSEEIDKEALRVLSSMPDWEPGLLDDKPVNVKFTQPLTFKLE